MDYLKISIVTPDRKDPAKKRWVKVGAAFPNKLGGYNLVLDMPITVIPGVCDLVLAEDRGERAAPGPRKDEVAGW